MLPVEARARNTSKVEHGGEFTPEHCDRHPETCKLSDGHQLAPVVSTPSLVSWHSRALRLALVARAEDQLTTIGTRTRRRCLHCQSTLAISDASGYTAAPGPGPGPAGLRRRGALMHMRFRKDPGPPAVVSALFLIASTWRRKVCKCRRMFLLILTRGAKASV